MPKLIGFALASATLVVFTIAMVYDVYFKGSSAPTGAEGDGSA
jgi:hypothetical protein